MIEAVPRILAEVRGRDDLHHALRARAEEVDISRPMIDHIAGLSSAYASKVLAADPLKGLTIDIAGLIAGALGCRILLVEDPDATARMQRRGRSECQTMRSSRSGRLHGNGWVSCEEISVARLQGEHAAIVATGAAGAGAYGRTSES